MPGFATRSFDLVRDDEAEECARIADQIAAHPPPVADLGTAIAAAIRERIRARQTLARGQSE